MKILKNILIGFGVLFVAIIGLIVFLSADSSAFEEKQAPFISGFMNEFSESWEVTSVHATLSNGLLKQIDSPTGRNAMDMFRRLGSFVQMTDLVLQNYNTSTSGKTGQFTFKGQFTHGPALVEITLGENDGKTLVNRLHITPAGELPPTNTKHEA